MLEEGVVSEKEIQVRAKYEMIVETGLHGYYYGI